MTFIYSSVKLFQYFYALLSKNTRLIIVFLQNNYSPRNRVIKQTRVLLIKKGHRQVVAGTRRFVNCWAKLQNRIFFPSQQGAFGATEDGKLNTALQSPLFPTTDLAPGIYVIKGPGYSI